MRGSGAREVVDEARESDRGEVEVSGWDSNSCECVGVESLWLMAWWMWVSAGEMSMFSQHQVAYPEASGITRDRYLNEPVHHQTALGRVDGRG